MKRTDESILGTVLPFLMFIAAVVVANVVFGVAFAQTKPADPPTTLQSVGSLSTGLPSLTAEQKVPALIAQHKLDAIEKQLKDLAAQFQQLQQQAKTQYDTLTQQQTKAKTDLDAARAEAFKAAKVDQAKYDLDDDMNFKAKPDPVKPNPPSPGTTAK